MYFDSMVLAAAEQGGDCEEDYVQVSTVQYSTVRYCIIMEDYVQFGRDILFITSHRSEKVTTRPC